MIPKYIIHLLSGGLDSTVMLYDLQEQGCKIHCVLFDYKQRHAQELNWARHHCNRLGILFTTIDIPELRGSELTDGMGGVVVPNRNAVLLSLAVNVAVASNAELVTYGCNKDDAKMFPDCRSEFVKAYNEMLKAAEIDVQICVPYIEKSKWEIADIGRQLDVKFEETWSCYRGGIQPCGECVACVKRAEALK